MANLKLIDGSIIDLNLNSEDLQNHFNDRRNCTLEILHQFNDLNYYLCTAYCGLHPTYCTIKR